MLTRAEQDLRQMKWYRTIRRRDRRHRRHCFPGHRCEDHRRRMSYQELLAENLATMESD